MALFYSNHALSSSTESDKTTESNKTDVQNLLPGGNIKNTEIAEKRSFLGKQSDTCARTRNNSCFPEMCITFSSSRTGERISSILTLISIVMCLVSFSVTVAILVLENETTEQTLKQDETFPHEICIQCIKLIGNQFSQLEEDPLVSKLRTQIVNGIQMCCAQNAEQMSALLQATMREQGFTTGPTPQTSDLNLKFTPVSVHKSILPGNESELSLQEPIFNDGPEHFLVRFNKDYNDPLTEHVRGVHVLDTALEINYTGLYYIYLSVHMASEFVKPAETFLYQHWFQYVHRTSPDHPANTGILLQTSSTAHDGTGYHETAFAGGQFYLTKGDHIEVCISGQGLIQYKKESTYLGLFMLASDVHLVEN